MPAHMLVKLSLGHRCQAMIVLNGQLAQHYKSLLFCRKKKNLGDNTEGLQSQVKYSWSISTFQWKKRSRQVEKNQTKEVKSNTKGTLKTFELLHESF